MRREGGGDTQRFDNGTFIWLRAICVNGEKFTVFTIDASSHASRSNIVHEELSSSTFPLRKEANLCICDTKISFLLIKKIKLSDGMCIF